MPPRFNIPPLTRTLLLTTFASTLIYAGLKYKLWMFDPNTSRPDKFQAIPYLTIVPGASIFYPWVFMTATFVEGNIFTLILALNVVFYGGKYLERAWGSRDFGKFLLVVSLVPNFVTAGLLFLWYSLKGQTDVLLSIWINGSPALIAAFLVSFKQLVPEHTVTLFRSPLSIRVKHFALLYLVLITLPAIIYPYPTATVIPALLSWTGFLSSWTYLRFFKRFFPDLATSTQPLRGDASETFSFAGFFPEPLYGPVNLLATKIFDLLVAIRVCTPFSQEDVEAGNARAELGSAAAGGLVRTGGGSGARAEAERRRQLALRALDARLQTVQAKASPSSSLGGVTVEGPSASGSS